MNRDTSKEQALAEKIVAKASDALGALDREMRIMKWPNEFRVIMWEAVAAEAQSRAIAIPAATPQDSTP